MSSFESVDKIQENERVVDIDMIWLLGQVNSIIRQLAQRELKNSPISVDALWILATIVMLGSATPSQLSEWMVRKPNTISAMTTRLEEKGFIEKQHTTGPNNRRRLRIILTEKGKQFLNMMIETTLIPAVFSGFTLEEKRQLRSLLFKARGVAAQKIKGYKEPPFPSAETPSVYHDLLS